MLLHQLLQLAHRRGLLDPCCQQLWMKTLHNSTQQSLLLPLATHRAQHSTAWHRGRPKKTRTPKQHALAHLSCALHLSAPCAAVAAGAAAVGCAVFLHAACGIMLTGTAAAAVPELLLQEAKIVFSMLRSSVSCV
jgi:hypothetical protein